MKTEELKHKTENGIKIFGKPITKEIRKQLREPFPNEALGKIASKPYLTSIKAMYIIERLNNVFGIGRWDYKSEVIKEQDDQVLIKGQLIILDYNCRVPEQYGSHKIKGKGVELADGYKSAITDGITKSASYLEIGIDVFKGDVKPPPNSNTDEQTKKDDEKPWLNTYTKKDGFEFTKQFVNAWKGIHDKGLTIEDIRKEYKVSKDVAIDLANEIILQNDLPFDK